MATHANLGTDSSGHTHLNKTMLLTSSISKFSQFKAHTAKHMKKK